MNKYLKVNNVYCMDCFDFLDNVEPNSVDLAVIDPPYNMNKAEWDAFPSYECFLEFTRKWLKRLDKALKPTASIYVFNTPYNCAFIIHDLLNLNYKFQNWITWDKRDGLGSSTKKYAAGQETILFFTKTDAHTFNADEIRVPYESQDRIAHAAKKGIIKNGKRWYPNENGRLCGEVWHISSERHKNKVDGKVKKNPHVAQKPIEMIERIIKASSNPGDLVIDCFVGSGTTAVAAKALGRKYICADSSQEYVDYTLSRLNTTEE